MHIKLTFICSNYILLLQVISRKLDTPKIKKCQHFVQLLFTQKLNVVSTAYDRKFFII